MLERILNTKPMAPPPRDEFRAQLRDRFVSGELDWASPEAPLEPDESAEEDDSDADVVLRPWSLRVLLPIAAVAAAVLLVMQFEGSSGSRDVWSIQPIGGIGPIQLAGLAVGDLADEACPVLGGRWASGERLVSLERELLLELPDQLRLRVDAGSEVIVQTAGAGGKSGELDIQLVAGRLLGSTGPDYASGGLRVHTARGVATIVATEFVVDAVPMGSCFCVLRGQARVHAMDTGRVHDVLGGSSTFLYADGSEPTRASLTEGGGHLGDEAYARKHSGPLREFAKAYAFE